MRKFFGLLVLLAIAGCVAQFIHADDADDDLIRTANEAMPQQEKEFVKAVGELGGDRFIDANALQGFDLRRQRALALCGIVPNRFVSDWVGRVEVTNATTIGDAILKLYLYGPNGSFIENWNERTSSIEDKFPISRGTPLFSSVEALKQYQLVRFSGEFQESAGDCIRTDGSTIADEKGNLAPTMMGPTFVFEFVKVSPLD